MKEEIVLPATLGYWCRLLLLSNVYFMSYQSWAQNENSINSLEPYKDTSALGWYYFPEDSNVSLAHVQSNLKSLLGLGMNDSIVLINMETDTLGYTHCKYNQYHRGYEVQGALISAHARDNVLLSLHGKWVTGLNFSTSNLVSEATALNAALQSVNAERYVWEDSTYEQGYKTDLDDNNATYYPEGKLLIAMNNHEHFVDSNFRLCWNFRIMALEPEANKTLFIDAVTGMFFNEQDERRFCNGATGVCQTAYDGVRLFQTKFRGAWNDYILADCRGIEVKFGRFFNTDWGSKSHIDDKDNSWSRPSEIPATSALWAMENAWSYFSYVFGRYGTNTVGKPVRIYICNSSCTSPDNTNSADWHLDTKEKFNNITAYLVSSNPPVSLDVLGHEYTHGVIHDAAKMKIWGEPGAIIEGLCDIFGEAIENFAKGTPDWIHGQEVGGALVSSFVNPHLYGQPDTYINDPYWLTLPMNPPFAQIMFVARKNSGVLKKWFYLLVNGGTHNGITVDGIGFQHAMNVVYRTMVFYLHPNSNFVDMRNATLLAAMGLFGGSCAHYSRQCAKAWNAVGVGNITIPTNFCAGLYGSKGLCQGSVNLYATDHFPNAQYTWTLPVGWSSSVFQNFIFFTPSTSGNASITVTISWNGQTISKSRTVNVYGCSNQRKEPVSMADVQVKDFEVYPNPAGNHAFVKITYRGEQLSKPFPGQLFIYDMFGKLLKKEHFSGIEKELELSVLSSGSYILYVRLPNYERRKKLVIVK